MPRLSACSVAAARPLLGSCPSLLLHLTRRPPSTCARRSNMDNRRVMKGNTLYLPVQVEGAYLSMGDAHLAQVCCSW